MLGKHKPSGGGGGAVAGRRRGGRTPGRGGEAVGFRATPVCMWGPGGEVWQAPGLQRHEQGTLGGYTRSNRTQSAPGHPAVAETDQFAVIYAVKGLVMQGTCCRNESIV